ncbi:MAG: hypothetical protein KY467_11045 [Gemmatimonadetes bacterium]|nr:hypothetical protein [Gemmatimonadota bacterium]
MTRSASLLILAALPAQDATAQQSAAYVPTDSAIAAAAAAVVQNADRCVAVWPGYWHAGKPFGLTRREDRSVFVHLAAPHPDFTPVPQSQLPDVLRGAFYVRRAPAGEFRPTDIFYRIGEVRVPVLRPYSPTLRHNVELVYHEAFHAHQDERFAPLPGGRAAFGSASAAVALAVPPAEFEALARAERQVLAAALSASSPDSLRSLLRSYLQLRARRTAMAPDAQPFEQWEERIEGTAEFVGASCAALATDGDREQARGRLRAALAKDAPALAGGRPSKWRAYAVGAALSMLLDDLRVPDWRAAVESGAALDDLLAHAVSGR